MYKYAENCELFTPISIIDSARNVMGGTIDLDPTSSATANARVRATRYYTVEQDALSDENVWDGNIWLNPPYNDVKPFADKLVRSKFKQAIVLTNNATETRWFNVLQEHCSAMVFSKGRIKFVKGEDLKVHDTPKQGQCFFYFGNNTDKFAEEFKKYGWFAYPDSAVGKAA